MGAERAEVVRDYEKLYESYKASGLSLSKYSRELRIPAEFNEQRVRRLIEILETC